jgi:Domain of unknown function (DUF6984)
VTEQSLRNLTRRELDLVHRLLEEQFDARNELVAQLEHAQVRTIDQNGSLMFRVVGPRAAQIRSRVPVEGEAVDADGMTIHVLLHVVDGQLNELELFKDDLGTVIDFPSPSKLTVMHCK